MSIWFKKISIAGALLFAPFLFSVHSAKAENVTVVSDVVTTSTASSAKIIWSAFDSSGLSKVYFLYDKNLEYNLTSTIQVAGIASTSGAKYYFATSLSNLQPGSKYYYKIIFYNGNNSSSVYTSTFTTLPADTSLPKLSRIVSVPSSITATISWYTDKSTESEVAYRSATEPERSKFSAEYTTEHHLLLSDLKSGTQYFYRVISRDRSGNVGESSEYAFRTLAEVKQLGDVSNVKTSNNNGVVVLTWNNPTGNFDKVVIIRNVGAPVASPADGIPIYEGRGEMFLDKTARLNIGYYYTIYAYDLSGKNTPGITVQGGVGTYGEQKIPTATITSSLRIKPAQLKFFTSNRKNEVKIVDTIVTGKAGEDLSVALPTNLLPLAPQSVFITLFNRETYQFFPDGDTLFTDFKFPSGEGIAYIKIEYVNGSVDVVEFNLKSVGEVLAPIENTSQVEVKPEVNKPAPVMETVQHTTEAIKNFASNEEVKQTVSTVVAPTVVGVATVSTVTAVSWVNIWPFLQLLIFQPLLFLGRGKKTKWGMVYNSLNKMPVGLATVRLINKDSGRVVQSKVTDTEGRFSFIANPGRYAIQVVKDKFSFPSELLRSFKNDGSKVDIYHGETLSISEDTAITVNIPLDPAGQYEKPVRLVAQQTIHRLQKIFSWIGFVAMVIFVIISPKWYMWVLLLVQVLSLLLSRNLVLVQKVKNWGIIYDGRTKAPLQKAVVRLYSARFNKMIAAQITDKEGRYNFMVGDNEYYVTSEKEGYVAAKTGVLKLRGASAGSITVDIALQPI